KIGDEGITVTDNGPGIPQSTVEGVIDYAVRVSSRDAYVSPTRGAQGNALKTILAMPFVLSGEEGEGRVTIETQGVEHDIRITLDRVRQEPCISTDSRRSLVKTGTSFTVHLPCSLHERRDEFLQMALAYALLNPHLEFTLDWRGHRTSTPRGTADWQ